MTDQEEMVPLTALKLRIEAVEEAFEFFLAYAAQGVSSDETATSGGALRGFLEQAVVAVGGIADHVRALMQEGGLEPADAWADLLEAVERDARASHAALRLVAARPSISSQVVDNLTANVHLRALLTDFFLLDGLPR